MLNIWFWFLVTANISASFRCWKYISHNALAFPEDLDICAEFMKVCLVCNVLTLPECYDFFLLFPDWYKGPAPSRSSLYDLYWGKFQNRPIMTTYHYLWRIVHHYDDLPLPMTHRTSLWRTSLHHDASRLVILTTRGLLLYDDVTTYL